MMLAMSPPKLFMNREIVYSDAIKPDQTIDSVPGPGCERESGCVVAPDQTIELAEPDQTIDCAAGA
jgi:hypothetical protein